MNAIERKTVPQANLVTTLLLASLLSSTNVSLAQTASTVEELINSSKILPAEYKIRASVAGPEVTITTYRNVKATDQDCKIDAILIAQKVMATYKKVAAVRTQFYNSAKPSQFDQVEIHAGDVKAFGSGGMTKQRLLDSLPVSRLGAGNEGAIDRTKFLVMLKQYKVVPGFGLQLRQKILQLLQEISAKNGDATEYWPAFEAIEHKIKAGLDQEIVEECNYLHNKIYIAYSRAVATSVKREDAQLAQIAEITSRNAVANFQPHVGPMYKERVRLTQQIARRAAAGEDVKWYQSMLINHIERFAMTNDLPHLKSGIAELEMRMGLAPM